MLQSHPTLRRALGWARMAVADLVLPVALAWGIVLGIHHHHRRYLVTNSDGICGPIRLRLQLPGTEGRIPEPLLVCGKPGNASLIYIRFVRNAHARVGVEFWGLAQYESQDFALPSAQGQIDVTCSVPALFPKEGDAFWERTPPDERKRLLHQYSIEVDGVVQLQGSVDYDEPTRVPIYFGRNPVGGSVVSALFTGRIVRASSVGPPPRNLAIPQ